MLQVVSRLMLQNYLVALGVSVSIGNFLERGNTLQVRGQVQASLDSQHGSCIAVIGGFQNPFGTGNVHKRSTPPPSHDRETLMRRCCGCLGWKVSTLELMASLYDTNRAALVEDAKAQPWLTEAITKHLPTSENARRCDTPTTSPSHRVMSLAP
jgi:hypothetical protein